jgi:ATP synthase I subunit
MQDSNDTAQIPASAETDNGLNSRVFRTMAAATALAVVLAAFFAPWRITTGLLVGGLLALFSHSWLKNSAAAAIRLSTTGGRPQIRLAQFVLRYVVIAAVVFAAHTLNLISLPAVLIGLSSFVVAMFVEALREFYFAIKQREEIS